MVKRRRLDEDHESEIFLQWCLRAKHRQGAEAADVALRTFNKYRVDEKIVRLVRRLIERKRIAVLPTPPLSSTDSTGSSTRG